MSGCCRARRLGGGCRHGEGRSDRPGSQPGRRAGAGRAGRGGCHAGRLHATTDPRLALERADVSLICVGTPSTQAGSTDLTYIKRAVRDIAEAARVVVRPESGFHSIVIRSTVPPGTVDEVVAQVLADVPPPDGLTFGTAMCPEFLREGSGLADFFEPPFVVVGTDEPKVGTALTDLFAFLGVDGADRRRPDGGGTQVRLQRVPRHQGLVRERDGPDLPALRRGLARGDEDLRARTPA